MNIAPITVPSVNLKYRPGDSYLNRAHARVIVGSRLTLTIEIDGRKHDIWLAQDFRCALKIQQLTKKRRDKIIAMMPAMVEVEKKVSEYGTVYYKLTEACLAAWAQSTGIK